MLVLFRLRRAARRFDALFLRAESRTSARSSICLTATITVAKSDIDGASRLMRVLIAPPMSTQTPPLSRGNKRYIFMCQLPVALAVEGHMCVSIRMLPPSLACVSAASDAGPTRPGPMARPAGIVARCVELYVHTRSGCRPSASATSC
eukprot:scaffold5420_cov27-Tisochrysis_lutea.AAC.3